MAQIGKELDGLCADAYDFVRNCLAYHSYTGYKSLSFIKTVLVKDLVFNLINTLLPKGPRTREYHSDHRLAKNLN